MLPYPAQVWLHFHHEVEGFARKLINVFCNGGKQVGNGKQQPDNTVNYFFKLLAKEGVTGTRKKQVHFRRKEYNRHPHKDKVGMGHSEAWLTCTPDGWYVDRKHIFIQVIRKKSSSRSTPVPYAFTFYPPFQWYPQSKEILLNLGMKCWSSAFNAQDLRVIVVVVQVGTIKIYVAAVEALEKGKRGWNSQFTTKVGGKLVFVPDILFSKISFPVTHLMPYHAETDRSRPLIAWLYSKLYCINNIP